MEHEEKRKKKMKNVPLSFSSVQTSLLLHDVAVAVADDSGAVLKDPALHGAE